MENIRNDYPSIPVDAKEHEIRVLELLPNIKGAKIHGRLVCISLNGDHVNYEALSYTWSTSTERSVIALNNNDNFQIPVRLEVALQDLRMSDRPLMIWIDAICINQRDVEERNAQVQLMRRIYRQAIVVRIWLDMDIAMDDPAIVKLQTLTDESTSEDLGSKPYFWAPVKEIFDNPYWKRVWIQQEIANASSLVLQCRSRVLPVLPLYHYTNLMSLKLNDRNSHQQPLWIYWQPKSKLSKFSGSGRFSLLPAPQSDLLSTLVTCAQAELQCSDDRDRVYGVLSLAENYLEGDIRINYSLSIAEVYTSVPEYVINKYNSLEFLTCASANTTPDQADLPTWVPDWRNWRTEFKYHDAPLYRGTPLSSRVAEVPRISRCLKTLHVQGFCFDILDRAFRDISSDSFPEMPISIFLEACAEIVKEAARRQNGVTLREDDWPAIFSSPLWNGLVRTLTWQGQRPIEGSRELESYYQSSRDLLPMMQGYQSYFQQGLLINRLLLQSLHPAARDIGNLLNTVLVALISRFPFVGSKGGIGLATKLSQIGDEVWILFGCSQPMILRRQDDHYLVVGSAYLDGAVRGDTLRGIPNHVKEGGTFRGHKIESISLR